MLSKRHSLYKTKLVDGNKEVDYLDTLLPIYEAKRYENFVVPQYCVGRIDLISYLNYQTVDYWWLITQANGITDPINEIVMGQELIIPSIPDYYDFYDGAAVIDDIEGFFQKREIT